MISSTTPTPKRFAESAVVILLLVSSTPLAVAQLFGPNLEIAVTNSTREPVQLRINGKPGMILPPFESQRLTWRLFGTNRVEMSFTADICRNISKVSTIPTWATDVDRWGSLAAITDEYLQGAPTEDDVKRRVAALKKALDGAKVLGRKELKHQIDRWFDRLKETGKWMSPICDGTVAVTEPLKSSVNLSGGDRKQITLFVREDRGRYRLNRR